MGSPSASLRPTPPCATNERGLAPQREQRPESDLPSADTETYTLVGLRRSLASSQTAPDGKAERRHRQTRGAGLPWQDDDMSDNVFRWFSLLLSVCRPLGDFSGTDSAFLRLNEKAMR